MQVLGIDAGGTKTVCYLADEDGKVLGEGRAGGANLKAEGELAVEKVLHTVMDQALGDRRPRRRRDLPRHGGRRPRRRERARARHHAPHRRARAGAWS